MRLVCYVNGIETPIVDGTIPNVPGAHTALFSLDPQTQEYRLVMYGVAGPDPKLLSDWLEPHGLKASPLP